MDTVERIVLAMTELMRAQGYAATGIKQVAAAADAPVGSIYHHFRGGKRDIAAAALRQSGTVYIQLLPVLLDPYDNLAEGVRAAFAQAAADLRETGWANLCLVGTVTGEIANADEDLRATADEVITHWVDTGSAYLAGRGLAPPDARAVIYALLSALEGAFLLARGQRSPEPLLAAGDAMGTYVEAVMRARASSRGAEAG